MFATKDPAELPWGTVGAQIVVESTGQFTDAKEAKKHLRGAVKKVIISAPAKNEDITMVLGVNENKYDPAKHNMISNASCTTNCLAPVVKVLHETVRHSRDHDHHPQLHQRPERPGLPAQGPAPRPRCRAQHDPHLHRRRQGDRPGHAGAKGKLDGYAMRVPTPNVSVVDLVAVLEKPTTTEEVNAALKAAAEGRTQGHSGLHRGPGGLLRHAAQPNSSIVDAGMTKVLDGNLVKVSAWYDNEWGYSSRVVDLIAFLAKKGL